MAKKPNLALVADVLPAGNRPRLRRRGLGDASGPLP